MGRRRSWPRWAWLLRRGSSWAGFAAADDLGNNSRYCCCSDRCSRCCTSGSCRRWRRPDSRPCNASSYAASTWCHSRLSNDCWATSTTIGHCAIDSASFHRLTACCRRRRLRRRGLRRRSRPAFARLVPGRCRPAAPRRSCPAPARPPALPSPPAESVHSRPALECSRPRAGRRRRRRGPRRLRSLVVSRAARPGFRRAAPLRFPARLAALAARPKHSLRRPARRPLLC